VAPRDRISVWTYFVNLIAFVTRLIKTWSTRELSKSNQSTLSSESDRSSIKSSLVSARLTSASNIFKADLITSIGFVGSGETMMRLESSLERVKISSMTRALVSFVLKDSLIAAMYEKPNSNTKALKAID
jgi:hypothetical protein